MSENRAIKLLVVDDDPMVRNVLARTMKLFAEERGVDLVLEVAEDGQAALDVIPRVQPDALLLDLRMSPWGDECGIQVTQRIRGDVERYGEPYILLYTAFADQAGVHDVALDAGVDQVCAKPYGVQQLLDLIVAGTAPRAVLAG